MAVAYIYIYSTTYFTSACVRECQKESLRTLFAVYVTTLAAAEPEVACGAMICRPEYNPLEL